MLGLGAAQIVLMSGERFQWWHIYIIIALEIGVAVFVMFGAQLFLNPPWPHQTFLDNHTVVYFYFVLALTTLYFSPWLMLCALV